jgi:hypothetical protein
MEHSLQICALDLIQTLYPNSLSVLRTYPVHSHHHLSDPKTRIFLVFPYPTLNPDFSGRPFFDPKPRSFSSSIFRPYHPISFGSSPFSYPKPKSFGWFRLTIGRSLSEPAYFFPPYLARSERARSTYASLFLWDRQLLQHGYQSPDLIQHIKTMQYDPQSFAAPGHRGVEYRPHVEASGL